LSFYLFEQEIIDIRIRNFIILCWQIYLRDKWIVTHDDDRPVFSYVAYKVGVPVDFSNVNDFSLLQVNKIGLSFNLHEWIACLGQQFGYSAITESVPTNQLITGHNGSIPFTFVSIKLKLAVVDEHTVGSHIFKHSIVMRL